MLWFALSATPNPATSRITLSCGMPAQKDVVIKIYDMQGSLVRTATIKQGLSETIVPTTDFSSGVYVLTSEQDASLQEKIIIVK
jgi:hypothetical protein